ncbi:Hypothetical predicted protein [Marmota monax]|uniref:Uncharacterized protein n=1 Tax=Marmota monax TaxID=9995 RepID=A0A5E4A759_MARMO|nr:hypothetical protein GHT09_009951 [Marmota monax]VTJ52531.1 Hypothetical predicted protein [Marmota monax]
MPPVMGTQTPACTRPHQGKTHLNLALGVVDICPGDQEMAIPRDGPWAPRRTSSVFLATSHALCGSRPPSEAKPSSGPGEAHPAFQHSPKSLPRDAVPRPLDESLFLTSGCPRWGA